METIQKKKFTLDNIKLIQTDLISKWELNYLSKKK